MAQPRGFQFTSPWERSELQKAILGEVKNKNFFFVNLKNKKQLIHSSHSQNSIEIFIFAKLRLKCQSGKKIIGYLIFVFLDLKI